MTLSYEPRKHRRSPGGRHPGVARRAGAVLGAGLLMIASAACGAESGSQGGSDVAAAKAWVEKNVPELPADVVDRACAEGVLSLYSLIPPGIKKVNEAFQKDIPCVKVEAFQASGGALAERFTQEQQSGKHQADVIQNFSVAFLDGAADKGFLEKYTPPNADNVPARWSRPGFWYGIGLDPMGVFWNTKAVSAAQQQQLSSIKTWDQLLTVEGLAGKAGIVDIKAGGTAQLPLYFLQDKYGIEYWQKLEAQFDPVVFDSITPLTQRLAAGSIAVGLDAESTVPGDALQKGAPLQWVYPQPAVGVPQMLGVAAGAPHMAAAQLYMAWSLSKTGLAKWSSANLLAPVSDSIPDERPFVTEDWFESPPGDAYYDADWPAIEKALPELTTTFTNTFK
ncbi:extracellular solute-binding protein [Rhizomonospora bruguierae]|uniref:extracellular solute-binding protein n=1 Tax=Rhizomonospora bruguierae TaxID=1581705 RepID=UPI001BCF3DF7|nr:extracellular solute-binding protein [Micromonospora sp. NBRC 107566]